MAIGRGWGLGRTEGRVLGAGWHLSGRRVDRKRPTGGAPRESGGGRLGALPPPPAAALAVFFGADQHQLARGSQLFAQDGKAGHLG